ncbi:MAG TPA: HAMP domain-containing sensor histidine kinase [Nitrospirota bacterium]
MFDSDFSNRVRALPLLALTVVVWLVAGMVYLDRFPLPFHRLELWLMPWKGDIPPEAGLDQRLFILQEQLNASSRISHYAFVAMIVSFTAFSMYLSVVYQQKQRRARENMLLVLKNQEIARRNEFIRYISATIGHEFKNNLGRIKRRIDLLAGLPEEARKRIDDNLVKLFADIDIFKKISDEREAGLAEFRTINLRDMLQDLAAQYGDLADIEIHETMAVPLIYAAPPLLKTVFENVIDNAIKYKKPDQARARVLVSCAMDADGGRRYVTVSLRDNGLGMDEQQADQCFYKGRGSGEGWGQGLYFAKYVVGLHAGRIKIGKEYTAPGAGTDIIINLPFVEEAPSHV